MTYTADRAGCRQPTDANNQTTTYLYDTPGPGHDRSSSPTARPTCSRTTPQGSVIQATDGRSNATTYELRCPEPRDRYDRRPGQPHDLRLDAAGNVTQDQDPTPGRPDGADDELCVRFDGPAHDGHRPAADARRSTAYDTDGNVSPVKDPLGRITTTAVRCPRTAPTVDDRPDGQRARPPLTTPTGEKLTVTDPLNRARPLHLFGPRLGVDRDRPAGQRRDLHLLAHRQEPGHVPAAGSASSSRQANSYDRRRQLSSYDRRPGRHHDLHLRRRGQPDHRAGRRTAT